MPKAPVLAECICDAMQELYDEAYDLQETGRIAEAEELWLKAWGMIPEPVHGWDASREYADSTAEFFLEIGKPAEALKFAQVALRSEIEDFDPSPYRTAGMIYFELGQLDAAIDHFAIAYERGGKRAFVNEHPKYFKFFMANK